jgi:predicted RNase H-like HicB family nuclease
MVEAMTYRVTYERDESGRWVASVPVVKGCHTQGRTVGEARRRIREALALFVENAETATLKDDIKLPGAAKRAIQAYQQSRKRAAAQEAHAAAATRRAVKVLQEGSLKMSARDAAELLDLSHQRVHQLAQEADRGDRDAKR